MTVYATLLIRRAYSVDSISYESLQKKLISLANEGINFEGEKIAEITQIQTALGAFDYIISLETTNIENLMLGVNLIRSIPHVSDTNTITGFKIFDKYLNFQISNSEIVEYEKADYDTIFISYGNPDLEFVEFLRNWLSRRGVVCWSWNIDHTIGADTWKEIVKFRQQSERVLILCSLKSLIRPAVKKEIEDQINEDESKIIPLSLDKDWLNPNFEVRTQTRNIKEYILSKNYADFTDKTKYADSLQKLLNTLKKKP